MMSSFWAGSPPAWSYVVAVLLINAGLLLGMWIGWGRGWEHCEEEQRWAREQAKARRTHPVYREPVSVSEALAYARAGQAYYRPAPEVAHEAWLAHEEQALAIANDQLHWCGSCGHRHYGRGPMACEAGPPVLDSAPDLRPDLTDSQWMAYKLADLDQYMAGLLGTHPATEELP